MSFICTMMHLEIMDIIIKGKHKDIYNIFSFENSELHYKLLLLSNVK